MHELVFLPAAVFAGVAAVCWAVCAAINWREARRMVAVPMRCGFRPVVIEGGRATAIGSLRVAQRPLGFAGVGAVADAARSYGG